MPCRGTQTVTFIYFKISQNPYKIGKKIEKLGVTLDFKAPLLEFEDRRHSLLSEFHALMMYQTVHFKAKCKERLAKCRLKKFYALNFFSRQKWRSLSPSFVDEFFGEFLKGATRCGFHLIGLH